MERCTVYRQLWAQQNRHLEPKRGGAKAALSAALVPGND